MADPATAAIIGNIIAAGSLASASAQSIANSIGTNRTVTIEFVNRTPYFLCEPDVYMDSGRTYDYSSEIGPCTKVALSFSKTPHTARGAVGCITYRMYQPRIDDTGLIHRGAPCCEDRIVIFFCCSYSGKNSHGIWSWQEGSASKNFQRGKGSAALEGQYFESNANDNLRMFSTIGADGTAIMNAEVVAQQDWQWALVKNWKRNMPKY